MNLIVFLYLLVGWGVGSAATTAIAGEPDLYGLPWLQLLVGVLISGWGGLSATLGRWLAARYDGTPWFWPGEFMKDAVVGVTVGLGAYFAGAWYGLHPMQLGLVLLLSGYLGVRLLSGAAERLLSAFSRQDRT